jgi:DNA invertase Pin-like site-specific DNA recombinase
MAGLRAAREKGRVGGRKRGLNDAQKTVAFAAWHLNEKNDQPVSEIIKVLKISRATFYRYLQYVRENLDKMPKSKVRRKKLNLQ